MAIPQFTAGQVLTAAELNAMVDAINAGGAVKVTRFTASGTFTPPTGVTYAVAYITGGGGGIGTASSGTGGASSVAFASGTVTADGGLGFNQTSYSGAPSASAGTANSGYGATRTANDGVTAAVGNQAQNGAIIVAGAAVTAGTGITVTVGAGGVAGTSTGAAGGSGYVYIEYAGG